MQTGPPASLQCEPLDWDFSPADVLRLVRADANPGALLGAWAGGCDIVCAEPVAVRYGPPSPWDALEEDWPVAAGSQRSPTRASTTGGSRGSPPWASTAQAGSGGPAFAGGWIGYLGFGMAHDVLPVPPAPGCARRLPSAWLGYYDHVLRRDRASGRWYFEALRTPGRAAALDTRLANLLDRARRGRPEPASYACGSFRLTPGASGHRSAVRRAIDYIRAGDIFQANICLRLEASFDGDPLDAFCAAAARLDPPYAAFLRPSADSAVASLSPELFLRRAGRAVSSRPIKGTCPRPPDEDGAVAARAGLERSAKNRAENVMIVDLMRNDLSRVCVPGSVRVPELAAAEPHPGVWHLVSEVRGELLAGASDGDLIRATFPPGSVTGAPKVRAIEVIHELEATPREIYTGAIGYRSPVAGLELNVAIRTFEFSAVAEADPAAHGQPRSHETGVPRLPWQVWLGSGGGIVAASRPADEYRECLVKAAPLVDALGGSIDSRPRRPARPDPALLPRPAAGVFTSVLVTDGVADRLGEHRDRLAASVRELYGKELPSSLQDELDRFLDTRPSGRLRITVRPLGGPLHATIECVSVGEAPAIVDLRPVVVPGGIGRHKWADRRLLTRYAAAAQAGPATQLLIEDADGWVLETNAANVFAVIGDVLRTPPDDGRLLPGITRGAVLRLAAAAGVAVCVAPVRTADLRQASEAFVTNSVRWVLPVRSVAGYLLPAAPGTVTSRIAEALAAEHGGPLAAEEGRPRAAARRMAGPRPAAGPGQIASPSRPAVRSASARHGAGPRVVVIDNYDSFTYNLVHYLEAAGCIVDIVRNDEVTASQVAEFGPAGVVISPGPCTPADAGISIEVVRECAARPAAIPVLGVCLGHQAIAACYGARIVTARRPIHGQTSLISHDGRGVLTGLPQRFTATRYHSLIVSEQTLPPVLRITARTRGGTPMGLRHETLPIEGLQFHPESVLTDFGHQIIGTFTGTLGGQQAG